MTGKDVGRNTEVRLAHSVDLGYTRGWDWFYTVDRTGSILRMIEGLIEVRP